MPFPLAAVGIGAALGLLKQVEAQRQASEERKRQAAIARYSPWTGMQAKSVSDPSLIGNVATGAAIGGMSSQMFPAEGGAAKDMSDVEFGSWLERLKSRPGSVYSGTPTGQ